MKFEKKRFYWREWVIYFAAVPTSKFRREEQTRKRVTRSNSELSSVSHEQWEKNSLSHFFSVVWRRVRKRERDHVHLRMNRESFRTNSRSQRLLVVVHIAAGGMVGAFHLSVFVTQCLLPCVWTQLVKVVATTTKRMRCEARNVRREMHARKKEREREGEERPRWTNSLVTGTQRRCNEPL